MTNYFWIFLSLLFCGSMTAQKTFYLKGGLNLAGVYGKDHLLALNEKDFGSSKLNKNEYRQKPRLLYTAGLSLKVQLSEKWILQPGLNYSAKGATVSQELVVTKNKLSIKNNYSGSLLFHCIDLPFLLGYQVKEKIYILAGVKPSFLLRTKRKAKETFSFYNENEDLITEEVYTDVKSSEISGYKRFDVGILLGVVYEFEGGLQIGLQGELGTRTIYKDKQRMRNAALQLTISYVIKRNA